MTDVEEAYWKLADAGRQLGGGPDRAAPRIVSAASFEIGELRIAQMPAFDTFLWGIAVGLVAANDPEALEVLDNIEKGS